MSLSWRETSKLPIRPPERPGFGTKLIDLNITRELDGTIVREYRDDGLEIVIEIPLECQEAVMEKADCPSESDWTIFPSNMPTAGARPTVGQSNFLAATSLVDASAAVAIAAPAGTRSPCR